MGGIYLLLWVAVFLAAVLLTYGASMAYDNRQKLKKRMNEVEAAPAVAIFHQQEAFNPKIKRIMAWFSSFGKFSLKNTEETTIQKMLIHANFRNPTALTIFYGFKGLMALVLPIPVILFFIVRGQLTLVPLLVTVVIGYIGYSLPQYLLGRLVRRRQDKIDRALPDVIDLFIICMEAGLSLQPTLNRVSDEIRDVCQEFYQELQITAGEMRTGITRDTALRNLGKRTGVESLQSLVTLMIQSEKLGTSLAQSLRAHADFSRVQRTLRAEEMAQKLPVKIVVPLVFFILPAMFIVIIGPGAIQMGKTLIPLLYGTVI
ncbi:MAG: type II secretion system F family protein [Proteobacteria bacterium]|nr:type II secretion system F family protein [Pseudomonadota bacterium]MBU4356701.1 type II secretion system F family protein [Pseudomonadota bacterium]MBU4448488.1 type II secretion system F family protein [Pseudomonadota bacterium]MCG2771689.1 type II secretion system F family protein [Desulfobacterales bacterium]